MHTEKAVKDDSCGVRDVTLRELASEGNFFAQSFARWFHLGKSFFAAREEDAKERFGNFLCASLGSDESEYRKTMTPDALLVKFRRKLKTVEEDVAAHMKWFVPASDNGFCNLWTLSGAKPETGDPIKMIDRICELDMDKPIGAADFQILRSLEMAAFYFYIIAKNDQRTNPEDNANDDKMARRFMSWLDPDYTCDDKEILEIGLQPEDRWRLYSYRLPCFQMPRLDKHLRYIRRNVLRVTFSAPFNTKIDAIVQARRKSLFQAFAKRFRDPQSPIWPDVHDMFGIRLIYGTLADMKKGLEAGSLRAIWNNNPVVRYCRTSNKYSQTKMRIKNQRVFVNGRQSEIQHIRIEDWLNIEYSVAPENHERYHLRWFTDKDGIFMHLFPPALYGVDWVSEDIRRQLHQHVINRVKSVNESLAESV